MEVSEEKLSERKRTRAVLVKFAHNVGDASHDCLTTGFKRGRNSSGQLEEYSPSHKICNISLSSRILPGLANHLVAFIVEIGATGIPISRQYCPVKLLFASIALNHYS